MAQSPDLLILNGALITFDEARPHASALAVTGGVITAVGETAEIRTLAGTGTRVIDAAGGTVMPGFIDSHVHLFGGSAELTILDLTDVTGLEALTAAVRPYAEAHPDEQVLLAVQADYAILSEAATPTRHDLDKVLPDRPLALFAPDHHTVWVNTPALELAGLLRGREVDAGSLVVMGDDGLATGELREAGAFGPVLALTRHGGRDMLGMVTGADPVPPATAAERAMDKQAIAKGLEHCAAQGITGLHNMDGNFYQLELLSELEAEGKLLCRTEIPFHLKSFDPLDRLEEAAEMRARYNGDMLWSARVKMFMDGVIDGRTALMLRPYPGTTDNYGDAVFEAEPFNQACIRADAMGLQISVHAIGDLGIRRTLDGYQAAREANGVRDSRHRIEHLEVMHPDDIPRIAELGAVASIQPGHAPFGGYFPPSGGERVIYDDQIPYAFAWNKIRATGAPVIFSTDWPVIPVDVMRNVQAAVAPMDLGPQWDDNTQSLMDTLASYTRDNAWVEFNEGRKGRLKPGMMADIVVMSHDLTALEPTAMTDASAQVTICGGRITHHA